MSAAPLNLGSLVPYFNSAVEPELAALAPPGVQQQTARFVLDANVVDDIAGSAEKLAPSGVDAFMLGLATESFPGGLALLETGLKALRARVERPVYAASFALHEALRSLGARRIGLVTPFDADANAHVRAALEAKGFEVVSAVGLARPGFDQIANTPSEAVRGAFAEAAAARPDALAQVGTGLPIVSLIPALEAEHAVPVVSSNQALYWQALRGSGRNDVLDEAGRLFER